MLAQLPNLLFIYLFIYFGVNLYLLRISKLVLFNVLIFNLIDKYIYVYLEYNLSHIAVIGKRKCVQNQQLYSDQININYIRQPLVFLIHPHSFYKHMIFLLRRILTYSLAAIERKVSS